MEKELNKVLKDLNASEIGIDDTFKFHCTQCGKCCYHRGDIILTAIDLYNGAKKLNITIEQFVEKYCECIIGKNSKLPVVFLKPVGIQQRCPLLVNNLCQIHHAKPRVCSLYPIGRGFLFNTDEKEEVVFRADEIRYIKVDSNCGDDSQVQTVREWISHAGISTEDEFFLSWQKIIYHGHRYMDSCISEVRIEDYFHTVSYLFSKMYMEYDTESEFLPQFMKNADAIFNYIGQRERT